MSVLTVSIHIGGIMTKDKYKYVEGLLRNYKKNKSRIKILELGLVTDDDYTLSAIDYSKDKIQTSNKSDLSDAVVKREKELEKLKYEVSLTDALLESLNTRDYELIYNFYMENKSALKIASSLGYYSETTFFRNRNRIINNLSEIVEG